LTARTMLEWDVWSCGDNFRLGGDVATTTDFVRRTEASRHFVKDREHISVVGSVTIRPEPWLVVISLWHDQLMRVREVAGFGLSYPSYSRGACHSVDNDSCIYKQEYEVRRCLGAAED